MKVIAVNPSRLNMNPEDMCMLGALYSRSTGGVMQHLEKVSQVGSTRFMETFYRAYNHGSIGQMGMVYGFLEDVSMLAEKAVQDNPLYNGQAVSSRYCDMAERKVNLPEALQTEDVLAHIAEGKQLYTEALEEVYQHLLAIHGGDPDVKGWGKTLRARAFDVCRSLLPAGITTDMVWAGTISDFNKNLPRLEASLLNEVADMAGMLRAAMVAEYPASFDKEPKREQVEYYRLANARRLMGRRLLDNKNPEKTVALYEELTGYRTMLKGEQQLLASRPRYQEIPMEFGRMGNLRFHYIMDFGSWRDMQRHRPGWQSAGMLTTQEGFEPWYLEQMPAVTRTKVEAFLVKAQLVHSRCVMVAGMADAQYVVPMGFRVQAEVLWPIAEAVYVMELRSGITVHPTVRKVIHQMVELFQKELHWNYPLYVDMSDDRLDVRRGNQNFDAVAELKQ